MTLPDITVNQRDGSNGQLSTGSGTLRAKMGVSSSGTAATIIEINSLDDVQTKLVSGPGAEACAFDVQQNGPGILFVPINGSVAGSLGTIASVGGGTAPTVTGTPKSSYDVIVTLVDGGAVGTSTFTYSLDNGYTTSAKAVTASTVALNEPITGAGTGLTINFGAGTYTAGSTHKIAAYAPHFGTSDLTAGFTALLADPRAWPVVHIVGANHGTSVDATNCAAAATLAATVEAQMGAAFTAARDACAIMDPPDLYARGAQTTTFDTALSSAFASFAGKRTWMGSGYVDLLCPLTGLVRRRPGTWPVVNRVGGNIVNGLLADDPAYVGAGSLPSVVKLWRDERSQPAAHDARMMALRTHVRRPGFYVSSSIGLTAAGSDYSYLPNRLVMDYFTSVMRDAVAPFLSTKLRVNPNGTIYELDAIDIETALTSQIVALVLAQGYISPPTSTTPLITVDRTNNLRTTSTLKVRGRATPLAYARNIAVDIGFNPTVLVTA